MEKLNYYLQNNLLRNIAYVFSGDFFAKIVVFVTIFLLANYLPVAEFGRYNYLFSLLSLIIIITDPFFNTYLRDFRYHNNRKFDIGILLIPILLIPAFVGSIEILTEQDLNILVVSIFSLNFILFSLAKTYLNVFEKYKKFSLVNVVQQISILLSSITLLFVFGIKQAEIFIEFNYLVAFISICLLCFIIFERSSLLFSLNIKSKLKLVRDSKYLVLYLSVIPLINFADLYFVEKYLSEEELGYYSFSLKLFNISLVGLGPLLTVFRIQQIDKVKEGKAYDFFIRNIKKISILSIAFIGLMVCGTVVFINVLFPSYMSSLSSSIILFCCTGVSYMAIPFSYLMALRKYKEVFILSVIALIIDISINYFLVPKYGIIAAAVSTFLAHSFLNIGNMIWSVSFIQKSNSTLKAI